MDHILEYIKKFPVEKTLSKTISIVVLAAICLFIVKMVLILFDKLIKKSKIDKLVYKILRVTVKSVLLFTTVIIVLSRLGVSVSSLVATLSVVGVAISLAIQGFLSNVFGGIQIISNKPFKIGDYVEAGGESGTVREVGLFYTKLDTPDKKLIQIPNSLIASANITNYSSAVNRRVEVSVCVSYDDDIEKVKSVLLQLLEEHPSVLRENGMSPVVHVNQYRDNDISYTARAWCANADYWTVYYDVMDKIKPTFDKNGIKFSYPNMNVRMITENK